MTARALVVSAWLLALATAAPPPALARPGNVGPGQRVAAADEPPGGEETWRGLPEELRERLRQMPSLSPEEQGQLRERVRQWEGLSDEERNRIRERYREYDQLSPEQRRLLKKNYRRWKELSPAEREDLRRRYEEFRRLDPEERERLEQRVRGTHRKRGPHPGEKREKDKAEKRTGKGKDPKGEKRDRGSRGKGPRD